MRVHIEIKPELTEEEVIIRCKELTGTINDLQKAIIEKTSKIPSMVFYKEKDEYYFPLSEVMFFETDNEVVYAHTENDAYKTDYKLYELQAFLPEKFIRISKSTIVNTVHILSISRNITSSSLIKFHKSHKQVYVSRLFYKDLQKTLQNRSN